VGLGAGRVAARPRPAPASGALGTTPRRPRPAPPVPGRPGGPPPRPLVGRPRQWPRTSRPHARPEAADGSVPRPARRRAHRVSRACRKWSPAR